jgi:hypothetical protein
MLELLNVLNLDRPKPASMNAASTWATPPSRSSYSLFSMSVFLHAKLRG